MPICSWCWSWGHFSSISVGWCGLFATPSWAVLRRSVGPTDRWWNPLYDRLRQRISHGLLLWSLGTILCEEDTLLEWTAFYREDPGITEQIWKWPLLECGLSTCKHWIVLLIYTKMTRQNNAFIVTVLIRQLWCSVCGADADNINHRTVVSEDDSFRVFFTSISSWSSFSNKTSDIWRSTSICKAEQKTRNSLGHIVQRSWSLTVRIPQLYLPWLGVVLA